MRETKKQNDPDEVLYNEPQFIAAMRIYQTEFESGARLYQKLKQSENLSLTEATKTILHIACKVDYLNRMICLKGQLPFDKLFEEVKTVFESVEELEQFITSMVPIFLHVPGKQNPRCTSMGFRKLVFHIADLLLKKKEVSEANIEEIISSVHPEIDSTFSRDTFPQKEFYMDFKSLRCLAAQVPCFNYNKQEQKLELVEAPDFENSLALWIDVLRPKFCPRKDMSRRFCCNAVTTKIYDKYIKARTIGCGKLSGCGVYILSMFLEDNKAGLKDYNQPAKSFISAIGGITPDDACQINVTQFSSTNIGWNMFDAKNHWGDIRDPQMIYKPKNYEDDSTNTEKPEASFTTPDIQTLCDDYDREILIERFNKAIAKVGKDSANYENVKRELEKHAIEAHDEHIEWEKHREILGKSWKTFRKSTLGPEPTTFEVDSKMRKELKKYMNKIANPPARPSLQETNN